MTAAAPRRLLLNGEPVDTHAATLGDLLAEAGFGEVGVATALNGTFVPAAQRAKATLNVGDEIEVLSARQGG